MVGPELITYVSEMDLLLDHGFRHLACWIHSLPQDYLFGNTYTNDFLMVLEKKKFKYKNDIMWRKPVDYGCYLSPMYSICLITFSFFFFLVVLDL